MNFHQANFSTWKAGILIFMLSVFIYQPNAMAQKLEITPYYGYMFAGKVMGYEGDLNVRNDGMYGLIVDININPAMAIEFYYSRTDTRIDFVKFRGETYKLTDASVNYFQVGVLRTVKKINKVSVYGVGSLGATLFSPSGKNYEEYPDPVNYEDWWLFSLTFGGGAKVALSDKIGLRFEGRFMAPITWAGGGFMVGTGGSGFYLGGGSAILQGNLMAGLTFKLGS